MSGDRGSTDRPELEDLVHRARTRLRDWTDREDSDPGVALVELFAFVAELLSRHSDQIADEAYLGTGRRRGSAGRRHGFELEVDGQRWRQVIDNDEGAEPSGGTCGLHAAVVLDNADPLGQRRLLVRVPDLSGDEGVWAAACLPVPGTPGAPAIGDSVWVALESGDPSRPIWLGRRITS